jgi:hypothetical protein
VGQIRKLPRQNTGEDSGRVNIKVSGMALATGVGRFNRRLAPFRSQSKIKNTKTKIA